MDELHSIVASVAEWPALFAQIDAELEAALAACRRKKAAAKELEGDDDEMETYNVPGWIVILPGRGSGLGGFDAPAGPDTVDRSGVPGWVDPD